MTAQRSGVRRRTTRTVSEQLSTLRISLVRRSVEFEGLGGSVIVRTSVDARRPTMTNRPRPWLLAAASLALTSALVPVAARATPLDALHELAPSRSKGALGFALEAGHDLDPHGRDKLTAFRMVPEGGASVLDNLGYSCATATFGLALGDRDRLVFFVRAGLAALRFDSWAAANHIRPAGLTGAALFRALAREGGAVLLPTIRIGLMVRF